MNVYDFVNIEFQQYTLHDEFPCIITNVRLTVELQH